MHFSTDLKPIFKVLKESAYSIGAIRTDSCEIPVKVQALDSRPLGELLHVDFLDLREITELVIAVPIKTTGISPGVKRGGILNLMIPNLELKVPRTHFAQIPKFIEINISKLDIGGTYHINEITLPEGMRAAKPARDRTLLSVVSPTRDKKA